MEFEEIKEQILKNAPKVICLCGSTRFMEQFFEVGLEYTLKGYIVLSVAVTKHSEHHGAEAIGQDCADMLDELHLRKIDLADEVFIINVNGYIGESTKKELLYALKEGKPVDYLESRSNEISDWLKEYSLEDILVNALLVDGGHHKQYYLEQLLIKLGFDIDLIREREKQEGYEWEEGIAP